jgi:hypothetical protein
MVSSFEVNSLLQLRFEMTASAFEKNTWKLCLRELLGNGVASLIKTFPPGAGKFPLRAETYSDFSTDF